MIKGDITDKKLLNKLRVDAIVNAANPTLMGSDQGRGWSYPREAAEIEKADL